MRVTVSAGSDDLFEKTVYVDVEPGSSDDGDDIFFVLLLIIVIIAIVAVVLVVMLLTRKKKSAGEIPAAAEGQVAEGPGVVVATEEVAAEPVQPEVQPAAAQPASAQMFQENIKCPSCQNAFTVNFQSKPVRVKCPSCGMEGVLN